MAKSGSFRREAHINERLTNLFPPFQSFLQPVPNRSFMTQSWTRHDVRESLPNMRMTSLRLNKRFIWYLRRSAWPSSPNLRPLAFALKV